MESPAFPIPHNHDGNNNIKDIFMSDTIRLNDEAIANWIAMDYEKAECLLLQSLTVLHKVCKSLTFFQHDPIQNMKTNQVQKYSIRTYNANVSVRSPHIQPDSSSRSRPYPKAFFLYPMIKHMDQESIHLIAVVVFYNAGLFYHLGGSRLLADGPMFRCQLVQRYYSQADTLLGRFMDKTRQPLWSLQSAIWHNLADSVVETFPSTSAAYSNEVVWVAMSQLEAFLGWVEDASDRKFFKRSIQLAHLLRSRDTAFTQP